MSAHIAIATTAGNRQSRASSSKWGKTTSVTLTSETIAADIAAFKKKGGRIKVLGNTPLRASYSTFRANAAASTRKQAAARATTPTP